MPGLKLGISILIATFSINLFAKEYGLKVDEIAPAITSKDLNGAHFELASALKKGPALVVFYRGGWCPYCNAQLHSLQKEIVPAFGAKGGLVVAISVDKPSESAKTKTEKKLEMVLVSDPSAKILESYKVAYKMPNDLVKKYLSSYEIDIEKSSGEKHHVIAIPSVFLIGRDGKIVYAYANEDYKVRADNSVILKEIAKLK